MLTRIRIEAAAQSLADVHSDLWTMKAAICAALYGSSGLDPDDSHEIEEVYTKLPPEERTLLEWYKGRLVIGFPIDLGHARGALQMDAVKRDWPVPGYNTSPADEEQIRAKWMAEKAEKL